MARARSPRTSEPSEPNGATPGPEAAIPSSASAGAPDHGDGVDDLSFRQARTALDLTLAELQGSDLDVEAMADLYRRAERYADRCEAVLRQVEQDVMQWDPQDPEVDPKPLQA
jgi:exodeoxyribonuclease VII small subunit